MSLCEDDILLAVAKAQGVMRRASLAILKADKHDGIRAVLWLEKHDELFQEIAECESINEEVLKKARKLAGEGE